MLLRKPHFFALAAIMTLVAGCGGSDHSTPPTRERVAVTVASVAASRDAQGWLVISGQVQAARRAELSTRLIGTLASLTVEEGQAVREGQVLGYIRSNDVQASSGQAEAFIKEAQAVATNAKRDLDRFEALYAKGSATQKELDDVRTGYARAQAQLEAAQKGKVQAEAQLGYATLVAPFSGVITRKFIQQGSLATPGMPIVALEGGNGFKLVARVAEQDIAALAQNQQAEVTVEALGVSFPARVLRITPSTAFTGAQYEVTLAGQTYPTGLTPGMFFRARVAAKAQPHGVVTTPVVPDSVLIKRGGLTGVYVVSSAGEALLRWVRTGNASRGMVEVVSGLSPGDRYVVVAQGKLQDGTPVSVNEAINR